jgi:hypothetical protein
MIKYYTKKYIRNLIVFSKIMRNICKEKNHPFDGILTDFKGEAASSCEYYGI